MTDEAQEAPEEPAETPDAAYDPFAPGQPIADFATGEKVRHVSYPPGCYAVVGDFTEDNGWAMTAYGLETEDRAPFIEFFINADTGGLGAEWEAYDG